MNLDDCYSEKERSPSGDIVANKQRFPSGMNYLTDQLHKLGLDIKLFQDWGFDLLKYAYLSHSIESTDDVLADTIIAAVHLHLIPLPSMMTKDIYVFQFPTTASSKKD
ncbi:hypothetical protein C0989_004801 [Termitomyces sp. Mn162]|nr:hypothetical protein C0989_004801 [Termitomyces sp. Mn162]